MTYSYDCVHVEGCMLCMHYLMIHIRWTVFIPICINNFELHKNLVTCGMFFFLLKSTWMYKGKYIFRTCNQSFFFCYLVLWHLLTWVHFLARQFPKETNTSGRHLLLIFTQNTRRSKTLTPFTPFHTNTEFWLIKHIFRTITWRISCYDFKTILTVWSNEICMLNYYKCFKNIFKWSQTCQLS